MRHHTLSLVFALSLSACAAEDAPPAGEQPAAGAQTEPEVALHEVVEERIPAYVKAELELLRKKRADLLKTRLDAVQNPLALHHLDLLSALYATHEYQPVMTADGALSDAGTTVLETLAGAESHAIYPEDVHHPTLVELHKSLEDTAVFNPEDFALTPEERAALEQYIATIDGPRELDTLVAEVLGESGPLNRLNQTRAQILKDRNAHAKALADLELLLTDGLLAYALEMKHRNLFDVDAEIRTRHGDARLIRQRLQKTFEIAASGEGLAEHIASLVPIRDQYEKLREALARYREIQSLGGWPEIDGVRKNWLPLRKGIRYKKDIALKLKRRLAAEGFFEGTFDNTFDDALEDALIAYQRSHQFDDDGKVEKNLLRSLNVPIEERIAQIEVTMERWRETRIGADPYYVWVDIPDFHAEIWKDGERIHRFRIIVGSNARKFDDDRNEYTFINETPQMTEEIEKVIFNPYWYPPPRVLETEHPEELAKNPNFYEENGFEWVDTRAGQKLRQTPGPWNALGKVKFLFPNELMIYMHDTPDRHLFRREVRDFSHGCMRSDDPLEYAKVLLEQEGHKNVDKLIEDKLATGVEQIVELEKHVPIHIEYYIVRVADDGIVHFNADVYDYDEPLIKARLARNQGEG